MHRQVLVLAILGIADGKEPAANCPSDGTMAPVSGRHNHATSHGIVKYGSVFRSQQWPLPPIPHDLPQ